LVRVISSLGRALVGAQCGVLGAAIVLPVAVDVIVDDVATARRVRDFVDDSSALGPHPFAGSLRKLEVTKISQSFFLDTNAYVWKN
jgi:hypothetical protein